VVSTFQDGRERVETVNKREGEVNVREMGERGEPEKGTSRRGHTYRKGCSVTLGPRRA
jgi:hypothetical protein